MRGNTIQFNGFRRSTKHLKYNGKVVPASKKWDVLFDVLLNTPDNIKKSEDKNE